MKLSEMIVRGVQELSAEIDGYQRLSDIRIGVSFDRNGVAYLRLEPRFQASKLGIIVVESPAAEPVQG